jgi:ABC-type phosphate transport system substrate-binding protein
MRASKRIGPLLVAGVSVAAVALSGAFGTASAMAETPGEQCSGLSINGQGSSLQKIAQEIWTGLPTLTAGKGFNDHTGSSLACSGTQGSRGKPMVTYTSSSSGKGQEVWSANVEGKKPGEANTPSASGDAFIGSDEPLTPKQMENIDEAAGAGARGKGQALVIPVAQAAVAVIVNPPSLCDITAITNENLALVWSGSLDRWSQITGGASEGAGVTELTAGACNTLISRVVRQDKSGTTFVFKSYLENIQELAAVCSGETKTWKQYAEPANNLEWPERCGGGRVLHAANSGGGGEAELVFKELGTIGYANLGDARAKFVLGNNGPDGDYYHWLKIQNQGLKRGEEYVYPGTPLGEPTDTKGNANCEGTTYTNLPKGMGPDDNWSEVSGVHTGANRDEKEAKNRNYPICTLTYDVGLVSYTQAGFADPNGVGTTAYDYLSYLTSPLGQSEIKGEGEKGVIGGQDYLSLEGEVATKAEETAYLVGGGLRRP